jgi:hypothetical protein
MSVGDERHPSCAAALHRVRVACADVGAEGSDAREACMRRSGVFVHADDADCARPTVCQLSGSSAPLYACCTRPTEQPQTVYGMPLFGGPSKVTPSGKTA